MGGFTSISLKDKSIRNIFTHNAKLRVAKVPKEYRFISEEDTIIEYEYFKAGEGVFPEDQFPKDKIYSLEDFKKYWSTEALGECFCAPIGALTFDCYFGRTSNRALRKLGKYVAENIDAFEEIEGSFSTFMEKGMTEKERKIVENSGIKI